jgi:hypothetical protein
MPGAQCTRSLVCAGSSKYAHQYSQRRHRNHPAFPTQWFYGLYVISPVTSSLLPPSSRRLKGFTCPVGPTKPPRDLAPATDARTTRLRRPQQCRSSCTLVTAHELLRPATTPKAHTTSSRPPHPALHVRDDRDTPLFGRGGMAPENHRFLKNRSEIFFARGLDDPISLIGLTKFAFARTRFGGPLSPHQRRGRPDNRTDSPVGQRDVRCFIEAASHRG